MKKRSIYLAALLIVAATLGVYWQTPLNDFTNFDDPHYVTENPYIRDGLSFSGVVWAFTSTLGGNWHPLTWLSHMLDIQLFGLNPGGHHLVSVLFHTANALLLFAVLARSTRAIWRSCCVALLFALHPLHVESVAWVAERKDVLASFFLLLGLRAYLSYANNRTVFRYLLVLAAFALGLMSKPTVITFPFLLLLLDYWPLGRLRVAAADGSHSRCVPFTALIREKVPFFVLTVVSALATFMVQKADGTITPLGQTSLWLNAGNGVLAYCHYLEKTLWPSNLAVLYPFDASAVTPLAVTGAFLCLVGVSWLAILCRSKKPYLATGWFWYVGSLVPMIGLVRVGSHAMADRYTYIPQMGLFVSLVWGASDLMGNRRFRKEVLALTAGAVLVASSVVTWRQILYWRNSVTLHGHALSVTRNNWVAHNNLGTAILESDPGEALAHFSEAVRIMPGYAIAHENMGAALFNLGNFQGAIEAFKVALLLDPSRADAHYGLGVAYYSLGNVKLALAEYRILRPLSADKAEDLLRKIGYEGR